jgi:Zn-dependent protease
VTDEPWQPPRWEPPQTPSAHWPPPQAAQSQWQAPQPQSASDQPEWGPEHPGYVRPPGDPDSFRARLKRFFAPLAGIAALLAKFGAVLVKIKSLTLLGSMAVSFAAYASFWGWKYALGFVLLILVHEMGHVIVLRARGIKAGWPVFLPFLGAFVSMQSTPRSVYEEAESALAGPVFGTAGALGLAYLAHVQHSDLLMSLAFTGLFINLFNLLPMLPLDGGRVAGALHPVIWFGGLVVLLGWEIYRPSGIIIIILLLGGFELYRRWKDRNSAASKVYFALKPGQRAKIGTAYLALIGVILIGMDLTYKKRTLS